MAVLRVGTCSWKYPSWAGLVYSAAEGIDYLEEYARQYDTVEIDQWFWSLFPPDVVRLPRSADVRAYARAVPESFRFTIKAPNSLTLTHFYHRQKEGSAVPNPYLFSVEVAEQFLAAIAPLHGRLGPLMFQFEYLNRQKMPSQDDFQARFAAFLEQLPGDYPYALETRNPNYLNAAYFHFLRQRGLIPVLLQGYYMPPVVQVYDRWRDLIREQPAVVVRLHGPDRDQMAERTGERWDERIEPRDAELEGVVGMARELLAGGSDVYLNVNNHYEGSAPLTIRRIRELLAGP